LTNWLPTWLAAFEKRITNNTASKHHLVGDKTTIADIAFLTLLHSAFYNEHHASYPKLKDVFEGEAYPNLQHYAQHAKAVI